MQIFFKYAVLERIITVSPINSNTVSIPKNPNPTKEEIEEADKKIDFFTVEEEKRFIDVAKHYSNYNQYRLILELGLRTSEMLGHKSTQITMDLYVHNTDATLEREMEAYSNYLAVQLGERVADDEMYLLKSKQEFELNTRLNCLMNLNQRFEKKF